MILHTHPEATDTLDISVVGNDFVSIRDGRRFILNSKRLLSKRCLANLSHYFCYDNSVLFIEILRQLVFVLLCIVMCDVIRSSPLIFGRRRKFTEREVHATVCYPEGLGDWTGAVDLCGQKPFR